jgi:regulator of sigma E protease
VLEFSIGFGAPLFKVHRGETTYALRSIPLGGFVRLAGMDDGDTGPRSFNRKPVWRRVSIIAAGAVTNLLVPIPIFMVIALMTTGGPVVAQSVSGPALEAGIPPGAESTAIDGQPLRSQWQLRRTIREGGGRPVTITYRDPDNHHVFERIVTPRLVHGRYRVGIAASGGGVEPVPLIQDSVTRSWEAISGTISGVVAIATGHIPGGLGGACGPSGPIGIVRASAAAAEAGPVVLLSFIAFLSVNLGILNLLPLPALDGGRLAFLVVEGVRRRPIDPAKEQRFHYVGLMVLLGLVLLISYNDIVRFRVPFAELLAQCGG